MHNEGWTTTKWHSNNNTYIQKMNWDIFAQMYPPLIEPRATKPYYTMSIWHVDKCIWTQVRCTPVNWTKSYRALLHHFSVTCTRMQMYPGQMYPPLIKPSATELYYTLFIWHVDECIWIQIRYTPCQIKPRATEPHYTMLVSHVNECICIQSRCTHPTPTNQTQCYKALLQHLSFTCTRMQTYPGQMYPPPPNQTQS